MALRFRQMEGMLMQLEQLYVNESYRMEERMNDTLGDEFDGSMRPHSRTLPEVGVLDFVLFYHVILLLIVLVVPPRVLPPLFRIFLKLSCIFLFAFSIIYFGMSIIMKAGGREQEESDEGIDSD